MLNLYPNSLHQMESAISLRYCPFPYGSKGFQGARHSRFHLGFNHATPLCVPQFSTTIHPVTRSVRHVNCMLQGLSEPSHNEGRSGNKILRGVTGVSLVLACVLGLFNCSGKMNPKLTTAYANSSPSKYDTFMTKGEFDVYKVEGRGRFALKSLLEIMKNAELATNPNEIPTEFSEYGPSPQQVNTLKLVAIAQGKSGKGIDALKTLKDQYTKCKNKWPDTEDYLGVALVEVSMFQKNFVEARKQLDEQIDLLVAKPESKRGNIFQRIKRKKVETLTPKQKCDALVGLHKSESFGLNKLGIAQRILYKGIVQTMIEDEEAGKWPKAKKEAEEWRKAFMEIY